MICRIQTSGIHNVRRERSVCRRHQDKQDQPTAWVAEAASTARTGVSSIGNIRFHEVDVLLDRRGPRRDRLDRSEYGTRPQRPPVEPGHARPHLEHDRIHEHVDRSSGWLQHQPRGAEHRAGIALDSSTRVMAIMPSISANHLIIDEVPTAMAVQD
jgi:hypothetical protein